MENVQHFPQDPSIVLKKESALRRNFVQALAARGSTELGDDSRDDQEGGDDHEDDNWSCFQAQRRQQRGDERCDEQNANTPA